MSSTDLILSFPDRGCFILEFDTLKSTMICKLTGLSSLETWDQSDTTYKIIMFSHRNCLSLILGYLKVVRILFIIKIMPIDRYTFSASVFHETESILDHKPCNTSAFL